LPHSLFSYTPGYNLLHSLFCNAALLIVFCCIHKYSLLSSQIFIDTFTNIYCCIHYFYFLMLHSRLLVALISIFLLSLPIIICFILYFLLLKSSRLLIAAFTNIHCCIHYFYFLMLRSRKKIGLLSMFLLSRLLFASFSIFYCF